MSSSLLVGNIKRKVKRAIHHGTLCERANDSKTELKWLEHRPHWQLT